MQNPNPIPYQVPLQKKTNGLAITSLVLGILSWLLAFSLACLNWVILPVFTLATLGLGSVLYLCSCAVGVISPLGWLLGALFGFLAKNQIRNTGDNGAGMAQAGFILNLVGLILTVLGLCGAAVILLAGGGTGLLNYFNQLPK